MSRLQERPDRPTGRPPEGAVWTPREPNASGRRGGAGRRRGLARASWVAIAAIGAALTALSLSRMQVYAVYANERDAVRTLKQLAERAADASSPSSSLPSLQGIAGEDFDPSGNAHWSEDGHLLRRNGYLFGLIPDAHGGVQFQAWPWRHAETGRAAYAIGEGRELRAHPNDAGRFSGLDQRPEPDVTDWLQVTGALRRY